MCFRYWLCIADQSQVTTSGSLVPILQLCKLHKLSLLRGRFLLRCARAQSWRGPARLSDQAALGLPRCRVCVVLMEDTESIYGIYGLPDDSKYNALLEDQIEPSIR